jgi:hypothetical protein
MHRVTSAIDPVNALYLISFPTGSSGTPAEVLIYNWKADRWAHVPVTCEMIYSGATQQSWTLEDLNASQHRGGSVLAGQFLLDRRAAASAVRLLHRPQVGVTFSGANAAVTIDTQEIQPTPGRRSRILGARPLIDGGSPQISVGTRNTQQGT